jgi:predicted lipid-binding transport protein (Tim44 family)
MDAQEQDRDHLDRQWVQDRAWLGESMQGANDMKHYNVPRREITPEKGFVGFLMRHPLMGSLIALLFGSLVFVIIVLLYF